MVKEVLDALETKAGFQKGAIQHDAKHAGIGVIALIATLGILMVANHFLTGNWWAH